MASTNSYGQEMVSIYLIKIKITTKFFKFKGDSKAQQNNKRVKDAPKGGLMYLPVKFEFDWTKRFRVRAGNGNVDEQTNGRNYTNFEMTLAMMVIYLPVKFEFDWTNCFRVKSPETEIFDGQTNGQNTDKQTELPNFERNLAVMVIYLPVKFEFDWTNHF